MRVAFIGLGNMGGPIARNLVGAGFDTVVADLDTAKVAALVAAGAIAAEDAVGAATGADVVLTSLPGPAQVRAVGEQIVPAMSCGSIWIDLSTNDLACAAHVAALAADHGVGVLDAPVSGGVEGAEAGTLTVLVGGDVATHARCLPVFAAIGSRFDLLGPHGAGYVAKIAQVMLCYLNSVCLTEALMLGVKGGVAPDKMLDIIRHSTGHSYVADRYGPEILNGGYDATFDLTLAAKDLRLAMELAADVGAKLQFTADVTDLYAAAEAEFGPTAPHLMAMRSIENLNDLVLHEVDRTTNNEGSAP
jgi:3-hydroxyisobutyrate dehydrogenase-like beta-hydroxyacid dehydrogenase